MQEGRGRRRKDDSSSLRDAGVTIFLRVCLRSFIVFDDELIEKVMCQDSKYLMYILKYIYNYIDTQDKSENIVQSRR